MQITVDAADLLNAFQHGGTVTLTFSPGEGAMPQPRPRRRSGKLMELITTGRLSAGQRLVWDRPRVGETHVAVVTDDGYLRLDDGREFASPSRACYEVAGISVNGWISWTRPDDGKSLHDITQLPPA